MKIKTRYIIFVSIIHLLLVLLSFQLFTEKKIIFIISEFFIIFSILFAIKLYKELIAPINLISSGIEAIKEKDFNMKFIKVGQIEMDRLIDTFNNMIEQLHKEKVSIQEKHYFLQKLITATPSAVIVLDFADKITSANPAAEKIFKKPAAELTGKRLTELKDKLAKELSGLVSGDAKIINLNNIKIYKCHKSHFLDRGFNHNFIIIEELSKEILLAEKKAYEKIIRMMTHELNNSIGAINSILDTFRYYKPQLNEEDREDYGTAIDVAINRNNGLSTFIGNFADVIKLPTPARSVCHLHRLLRTIEILMSAKTSSKQIKWRWNLAPQDMIIKLDINQFEQVLINIIKNAIEALSCNGEIIISTCKDDAGSLEIANNGKPIPEEVKNNLFTPFFTTKKNGQGIGLTLVREILGNHDFDFRLQSGTDGITRFTIYFK